MDPAANEVRVTNTQPRILHLPDKIERTDKDKDAVGVSRMVGLGSGKSLIPGGNNVERTYWEHVKKNLTVTRWLEMGWLTEGGDVSKPEGPESPASLASYTAGGAVLVVEGEGDPEVLKKWAQIETRTDVIEAIKKRQEAVGSAGVAPSAPRAPRGRSFSSSR